MLTPWKESYDQPRQHIKKQRHDFANKGPSGQGYGFSSGHVWMWELDYKESWALKNWCFWIVMFEKTLESLLDCKEIQPVHPKEINPECPLEGLVLKLKLQYFGHLMWRVDHLKRPWCWERLKAGREGDDRGWDGWMASLTQWTWVCINSGSWWWTGRPGVLQSMEWQRVGHDWVTELNWTDWKGWDAVGSGREIWDGGDLCMLMADPSMLLLDRSQHSIIRQLSSNLKWILKNLLPLNTHKVISIRKSLSFRKINKLYSNIYH